LEFQIRLLCYMVTQKTLTHCLHIIIRLLPFWSSLSHTPSFLSCYATFESSSQRLLVIINKSSISPLYLTSRILCPPHIVHYPRMQYKPSASTPSQKLLPVATQPPATKNRSSKPPVSHVSALSQQLQQQPPHVAKEQRSPPRRRHAKPSKLAKTADVVIPPALDSPNQVNSEHAQPQQQPKSRRSPQTNKTAVANSFSTPLKPQTAPPPLVDPSQFQYPPEANGIPNDLASHYAGPTFHSSPAPSSLPLPPIFAANTNSGIVASNRDATGDDLFSLPNQSPPNAFIRLLHRDKESREHDDSPLAPFFKADREQKQRLLNQQPVEPAPSHRPASATGIPEHQRSPRPNLSHPWTDGPSHLERFPPHNYSTSDLQFQMDDDFERGPKGATPVQKLRASTGSPLDYRGQPQTRSNYPTQGIPRYNPQRGPYPYVESNPRGSKDFSWTGPPAYALGPAFPYADDPPSPSPTKHSRTHSIGTPNQRASSSRRPPQSRRIVSGSHTPPWPSPQSIQTVSRPAKPSSSEDEEDISVLEAEKAIRRALKLR
jgi:Proline-rich nuclear receptor coactivator motif